MLTMMQESASIEEAISKIVRRVEFVGKMIRRKVGDGMQMAEFAHRLVRNYSLGRNTRSYSFAMQNIETILSLEPKSESHYIVDHLLMSLFPQFLTHPELRKDYLSLSLFHDIDWLAPLVVLMDYFTYY
jgi:hypothetical protein